jgi:TetR/AcrR family transcriptional regulator, cholesterol catabolism regulator
MTKAAERTRGAKRATKAEASRERVLAAAAHVFNERGYAGATMRAIAEVADMQAGSLYYYYKSKEQLVEAVLDAGTHGASTGLFNAIASLPPGASGKDRIRTAILAHLRSVLDYGDYALAWRRVHGQLPPAVLHKHLKRRDALQEFWTRILVAARDAGEIRGDVSLSLTRTFILTSLNSAVEWYRPDGMSPEQIAEQFATLIGDGLFLPDPA